jgi:hypothetical protein
MARRIDPHYDLDHDLTLANVRLRMALQHTDVQETMQRLRELERRVLKLQTVVTRSFPRRENVRLGLSAIATGERSVSVAGHAFIIFVIFLAWAVAIGHDQLFKIRLPLTTDFTLSIPNISTFFTFH